MYPDTRAVNNTLKTILHENNVSEGLKLNFAF